MKRRNLVLSAGYVLISAKAATAQVLLPDIVVTAPSPIQEPWRQAPQPATPTGLLPVADRAFAPITVVTDSELQRTSGATLGDMLANKPGLSSSSYAPGASRPIIRGLDNSRVRVQENGIGSMDVSTIGEDHGVPIDPLAAQKVEVIRGPASLRWGSQAIGGVVNADNNRIPGPDTPQGLHGTLRGALTSVDRGGEGSALFDMRQGNFAMHGDYFQRSAGDYQTPHGRQPNSALNMQGGSLGGSYIFDRGYVGVSITQFNSLYHVPGIAGTASNTRIDLEQTKINAKGEFQVGTAFIDTVRFWFGGSQYRHFERGLDPDSGMDSIRATFKNREYEGRVEAQLMPMETAFGRLTTAVGVQYGTQRIGTAGEAGGLLDPTRGNRAAAYIFNELQATQKLRFQAAARIEHVNFNGIQTLFPSDYLPDGSSLVQARKTRQFIPGSISLGALYDLPHDIVASVTAQYVQRAPDALELFAHGAHDATATFEIGNPNLRKEAATSIEFGLRRSKGPLRFDFTAYHTRYQGYISKRLTGTLCGDEFDTCGVDSELKQLVYTQRDATFTGAELSAQYDAFEAGNGMVGFEGQFDVVRARFTNGSSIARIPPVRLGGGIFYRSADWYARVNWLHAFAHRQIDPTQETPTKGYNLLRADLAYTYKFRDAGQPLELTFGISGNNLLNANIRNSTSILKDEVLMPGRTVKVFAALKF
ncbi:MULTISPECIES: TonB-dependent receptor [unclassified Beijerinckia]|uniref:TonB-dependent receptor n=1 Tax=unclassified Beijerinckia TaxID=2638183 RepID=UPI00089B5F97|nr:MULTISPECIES: TonB-dependent receptor [unclassified Beijerinckia]MDH7799436.1 iron complex outermembrane receptor protein [Beijerinckia sp. GAS462]SED50382.1 iron complex outermembrane recepter protein [Beijerinckia sp. 28-YEA-48]